MIFNGARVCRGILTLRTALAVLTVTLQQTRDRLVKCSPIADVRQRIRATAMAPCLQPTG